MPGTGGVRRTRGQLVVVSRRRLPMGATSARDVVAILERHRNELLPFHMWLPLKSPARAALKTILDQQSEIIGIVTGDFHHFRGKNTTPGG